MASFKIGTVWSDLDHRLIQDSEGKLKLGTNVAAVMSSIDNILRTSPGERRMLPEFGFGLQNRLVGESMESDELDMLAEEAKRTIEAWDDRPIIVQTAFFKFPDQNAVYFEVEFRMRGFDDVFTYQSQVKGDIV